MRCLVGVFGLGFLFVFLGPLACTRPATLKVAVTGVPAQSLSLAVSLAQDSGSGEPMLPMQGLDPYELPQPAAAQTSFVLRLPLASDTTLRLGVAAFSQAGGSGCLLGIGSATHSFRTAILDDEVELALTPASEDPQSGCMGSSRIVGASPSALTAAGGEMLQVQGWGFVPGARIVLNGQPLATRYVSAGQLEAITPPSDRLMPVPLQVELPGAPDLRYQGLRYIAKTISFSPLATFTPEDFFYDSEVADLDGDKRPDLIFYGDLFSGSNQIIVAFQRKPLQFTEQRIMVAGDLSGLAVSDLDGDGDLDLITVSMADQAIYVLKNDGQGGFAKQRYDLGVQLTELLSLHVADISGDGAPDLLLDDNAEVLYTFPNDGQGGFRAATRQATTLTQDYYASDVTSLDYDRDGHRDITLIGDEVLTLFSNPGPTLPGDDQKALAVELPSYYGGVYRRADMDGDGIQDLVLTDDVGTPYLLPSAGAALRQPFTIPFSCPTFALDAADLNGDGTTDLLLACEVGGQILFILQSQGLAFTASDQDLQLPAQTVYWSVRLADLDGDNKPELIVSASQGLFTGAPQFLVYRNTSQ